MRRRRRVAIVIPCRAFSARTSRSSRTSSGGTWYRRAVVGVCRRSIVVGFLSLGAVALSACGGGQSSSTAQKAVQGQQAAQAEKAKQNGKLSDTVIGMHYVQMAKSVDPLTSQLSAELSAGRALPDLQVKTAVSELEQFDAAMLRLSVPRDLRVTLDTLRTADERLVKDLTAIEDAKTVTPQQHAAARIALQRQHAAASALSTALGLSGSTH
jgi:hypothetical protein